MLWARLRSFSQNVLRRSDMERSLSEEMHFHLERRAEDLIRRRGLSPEDAMRTARLEFGSIERYKEEARQSLGLRLLDELGADLRYAFRTCGRNKGFTAAAIVMLALGIGANTAVFSVADALLLRPLPVKHHEELVVFDWLRASDSMVAGYSGYGRPGPSMGLSVRTSFSVLTFERFRDHTDAFSHVFAFSRPGRLNIVADSQADTASGLLVTGDYFAGLGIPPLLGRTIGASDDNPQAEPVAVISHRYWQRRFGGAAGIVGKAIDVNRIPVTIVGVTPEGFDGVRKKESSDVTLPIGLAPRLGGNAGRPWTVWMWWVEIMARLRPGITREQALAGVQNTFFETVRESWAARPAEERDQIRTGMPLLRVWSGAQGPDGPRIDAQQIVSSAGAIVGAVLLIACVNLATLLLVHASARRHEISVRLSLGASRWRVIRQMLTESLILSVIGGTVGAIVARWGKEFMAWLPTGEAPIVDARIDPRVLGFAAGLSVLTAIVFGIAPALRATRTEPGPWLKIRVPAARVTRTMLTKSLLAVQVAVSLVLLAGAALFVRTLYNFGKVDIGFDADNLLVFRVNPAAQTASPTFDLYDRLISAIEAVPGVRSATLSAMPLIGSREWDGLVRADGTGKERTVFIQAVRWNFLDTMHLPLLAGRGLTAADTEGRPPVAVINETTAREVFGEPHPIGRHFQFVRGPNRNVQIEVVGVAHDSKYSNLRQRTPPTLFVPYTQIARGTSEMTVELRTARDPLVLAPAVREAIRHVDAGLPLIDMKTERQQIAETIGMPRALALLMTASGVVGLLLACVGLYGIVSYDAVQRTSEIGIRMALGAQRADVLRLVMRQTMIVVAVGTVTGFGVASVASRLVAGLLFGIAPGDPLAIGSAGALLIAVAFVAAYVPARRASQLDPTQALRYE